MREENKTENQNEKQTMNIYENARNKKLNKTRTKLLLFIDNECNQYIKNCKVRFNNELPKEITKNYDESLLVSFSNPVITNFDQFEHFSKITNKVEIRNYEENITPSKFISNPSLFDFSKCLIESGKEFIDQRKINVSFKKLDQIYYLDNLRLSNYLSNNSNAIIKSGYTRGSIIQIDPLDSNFRSKSNLSTGRNCKRKTIIFPNLKKLEIEELFLSKNELEVRKIQEKFNKLQNLAKKLKYPEHDKYDIYSNKIQEFSSNNTDFNGELFDMLQFKGLKFDSKIIKQNQIKNSRKVTKGLTNKCQNFNKILFPQEEIKMEDTKKHKNMLLNEDSGRNSENILQNIHFKNSDNTIKNPFSKAGDKIFNANDSTPRRKIQRKPFNHTTKESNKLAAIIKKIRQNLFQFNQRNSYDSTHSIPEENEIYRQEEYIKNSMQKRENIQLPFEVNSSYRYNHSNDQYSNGNKRLNFLEEDEEEKLFVDSSEDLVSDNEINRRLSSCNLYNQKSINSHDEKQMNFQKQNLFSLLKKPEISKFQNLRNIYNSNLSKYSEVSRYSNSIADSVTCSFISKDPSNITRSSITKSEISNDYDYNL